MNKDKVTVVNLENEHLQRLHSMMNSLIKDTELMNTLDTSEAKSKDITERLEKTSITSAAIHFNSEEYRRAVYPVALIFLILVYLSKINHIYQFSPSAF